MAGALVAGYDRTPYVERVREFLHRDPSSADARTRGPEAFSLTGDVP
jgi:hypothetical protein